MRRNLSITEKLSICVKIQHRVFHYYPAFGDSLITIELLAVAWPPNYHRKSRNHFEPTVYNCAK